MRLSVDSLRRVVKRDLAIEFVPQQLTSIGGLELLRCYVQRLELAARLRRACAALGGDYSGASLGLLILALLYPGPDAWSTCSISPATRSSRGSVAWRRCRRQLPPTDSPSR